ncbi:hypothetical protein KY092_20575 [Natronomonas gomsonensis]|uniref:DUF7344 domain-containing protein n=1 Tax=Natronomonas gomsonensis TaxID=1046043 RepID=UPI00227D2CDB|nr:hypothetical protein [Natronomonas gomsonensis]MCY4732928.1 hypothetical protein [Natronomonas gomsonensis]
MSKTSSLPESVVYEILANPRRRATIRHLTTTASGRTVSLRDLATAIAAAETGQSPPPRASRESVYNSLHQTHLPKLDELGVVAYDREARAVGVCDSTRQVDRYLEGSIPYGLTWGEYYRGLGIVSLLLVVASLAAVPVVEAIDPLLWASGFLSVFALSALYQLWSIRWCFRGVLSEKKST